MGSLLQNAQQGVAIRLGNVKPIYHSVFTHSRLDHTLSHAQYVRKELYFLLGANFARVFHNGLIQGDLLEGRRLATGSEVPWVVYWRWGISTGGARGNFGLVINHLSPEFRGGMAHSYASLECGFRF